VPTTHGGRSTPCSWSSLRWLSASSFTYGCGAFCYSHGRSMNRLQARHPPTRNLGRDRTSTVLLQGQAGHQPYAWRPKWAAVVGFRIKCRFGCCEEYFQLSTDGRILCHCFVWVQLLAFLFRQRRLIQLVFSVSNHGTQTRSSLCPFSLVFIP
jgi:hypothetical protein